MLLPGQVIPCWELCDRSIGEAYYFEQRFWLASIQVRDQPAFRKQEKRRGAHESLRDEWGLAEIDFSYPNRTGDTVGTVLLSSRALVAWLLHKRTQTDTLQYRALSLRWGRCLEGVRAVVCMAYQALDGVAGPTISFMGATLQIGWDASCNLAPLRDAWPSLPEEWQCLRVATSLQLPPFSRDRNSTLFHLLLFLHARVVASESLPRGRWLLDA